MRGFTEMGPCRDVPCASCGHQQPGGYSWALHPAGERAKRLGVSPDALVCSGCRDCDAIRPTMSQETRRGIVARWGSFHERLSSANGRLAGAVKRAVAGPKKDDIPSPNFRVTLNPDAPGAVLVKLYKMGVTGDQVTLRQRKALEVAC